MSTQTEDKKVDEPTEAQTDEEPKVSKHHFRNFGRKLIDVNLRSVGRGAKSVVGAIPITVASKERVIPKD